MQERKRKRDGRIRKQKNDTTEERGKKWMVEAQAGNYNKDGEKIPNKRNRRKVE